MTLLELILSISSIMILSLSLLVLVDYLHELRNRPIVTLLLLFILTSTELRMLLNLDLSHAISVVVGCFSVILTMCCLFIGSVILTLATR